LNSCRTGYEAVFLDRQLVLQVLYKHIKDKSKVLTKKRLLKIDHTTEGVIVRCEDGTSYGGDIVAGADGVHSVVRQQMWEASDREEPGFVPEKEKQNMTAEYQILYGISTATPGLKAGNYDVTYMKDISSMVVIGKDSMVYWFLFKRLDRVYKTGEIPKYSKEDAEQFAETHSYINLDNDPKVKFGDVWKNRKYYTLVATEEADFKHWTWGRFVCLGDSVHKYVHLLWITHNLCLQYLRVTPNAGVGGNASLESATGLANAIKALVDSSPSRPSFEATKQYLKQYEKSRWQRISEIMKVANSVTRLQSLKGLLERITVYFVFPNAGDVLSDLMADLLIGATKLDFLPPPDRSLRGTMPFNPEQGIGKKESILYRFVLVLPFFALSALAYNRMSAGSGMSEVGEIIQNGRITWGENSFDFPATFYHIDWLDSKLQPLSIVFASSNLEIDPVAWWQMLCFITDFGVLYSIFLIESTRRSNNFTLAQL
jgi:2-polyprenyl-6-methoxyphenol hydroxylase-like FAD-dependent oxidoreductase